MSWEPPFSTGTECAEPTGLRRLLRHPNAKRNLTIAAGALGALVLLVPKGAGGAAAPAAFPEQEVISSPMAAVETPDGTRPDGTRPDALLGTPVTPAEATTVPVQEDPNEALYAIYLYKLPGLPPDATPGTELDIWVTWKPPITRRPQVQLLMQGVELGAIETGFEQGPVADLLVDRKQIPDLIYGERFGSLTATVSGA